jgi:hypothetical protein
LNEENFIDQTYCVFPVRDYEIENVNSKKKKVDYNISPNQSAEKISELIEDS